MPLPKKILLIDNNPDFRNEFIQKFHKAGYQVFQALRPDAALEIVEDVKMDLVFWGPSVANDSDEEFREKLRRTFSGKDVPLLVVRPSKRGAGNILKENQKVEYLSTWPMKWEDLVIHVEKLIEWAQALKVIKSRVLVAGADSEVLNSMMKQLEKDYKVQWAGSGSEAIAKAVQMRPDILVMDVLIDGVPAENIIHILRQMPEFDKKPILLFCYYRLSDLDREDVRAKILSVEAAAMRCHEAGPAEYIGRYNENAFLEIINKYL